MWWVVGRGRDVVYNDFDIILSPLFFARIHVVAPLPPCRLAWSILWFRPHASGSVASTPHPHRRLLSVGLVKCAARYVALIGVRSALLCPNRGPLQVAQDCEPGRSPAAGQSQRGVKCNCLTEPQPFWLEPRVGTERPVAVVLHFPRQRPLFSFIRFLIICLCLGPACGEPSLVW